MSDRETELAARWEADRPTYAAWGRYVAAEIMLGLTDVIAPISVDLFVRIPIKPRTKELPSLLAKAFFRGKPYADPYGDIEDKVGLRVVVLSTEDIDHVGAALGLRGGSWTAEKARDFEDERRDRPFEFDYQSVHYVVRSRHPIEFEGLTIPEGMPCEIQVRTLLQHAYSELTHDTIYKPSVTAQPDVKRAAAKSMALIEATDDYFTEVRRKITAASAPGELVTGVVDRLYRESVGLAPHDSPLSTLIIDRYKQDVGPDVEDELRALLGEKPFIADIIRERAPDSLLYKQAAILLAYLAVSKSRRGALKDSPLSIPEIAPVYSDLGLAVPGA